MRHGAREPAFGLPVRHCSCGLPILPAKRRPRLARLAAKYGPEIDLDVLLDVLASDCRWHRSPGERGPGKYDAKCGAYFPDLGRPVPPDLPPAMCQLRVVRGGES